MAEMGIPHPGISAIDQSGHSAYNVSDQIGHYSGFAIKTRKQVAVIYRKFYSLDPQKQQRIIHAAMEEFVRSGYEKASTNEIVKNAGISKGSLFQYFKSKKDLYLFLYEESSKAIEQIYEAMDWNETDLFERLRKLGLTKLEIFRKYPLAIDFIRAFTLEDAAEVKAEIEQKNKQVMERGFKKLYENIDWSKFRKDIDLGAAMQVLNWTMLGFAEQQRKKLPAIEEVDENSLGDWERYFHLLKTCFYQSNQGG